MVTVSVKTVGSDMQRLRPVITAMLDDIEQMERVGR